MTPRRRISFATLLCAAALVFAAATTHAQPAAEVRTAMLAPLLLDGETSLDVESAPELDLGEEGTLEVWLAALWEDPGVMSPYPAVLGRRVPYEGDDLAGFAEATRYSIHVAADRQSIGLFDGSRFENVAFDFSDDALHHVVFVTQGASTRVYIDGADRGTLGLGYGRGVELPLHIGSSDGESEFFAGAIASVRLWRGALTQAQIAELAASVGPPTEAHTAAEKIVAWSEFTSEDQQVVLLGNADGALALPVPPPGLGPRGLKDQLSRKRKKSKENSLNEAIEETEALRNRRQVELAGLRTRLQQYENAQPVGQGNEVDLAGVKFSVGRVRVGDRVMGANTAGRNQRRLEKRIGKIERRVDDYTRELDGGPPSYDQNGAVRVGLRQRLRENQGEAADAPIRQSNPFRRARNVFHQRNPEVGDVIETDEGNAQVVKAFSPGAFGGAWLIRREGAERPEVLKQQQVPDPAAVTSYRNRMRDIGAADFDEIWGEDGPNGVPGLTAQQALVVHNTRHEVEMWNEAEATGHPAFVPARLVGQNRMRVGYAGPNVGALLQDPDIQGASDDVKEAIVRSLLTQSLGAAAALQRQGLVHRDLHPGNLTVDETGSLKVIDFGLAKRADAKDIELELNDGVGFGGKYGQMSPELARAKRNNDGNFASSHKSDVFALGETFEQMFHDSGRGPALLRRPLAQSELRSLLENELKAQDPDQRPSAEDALLRLRQLRPPTPGDQAEAERLIRQSANNRVQADLAARANVAQQNQ